MHAIYHPEYKTERELDDAIARLEQAISEKDITYCPLSAAPDLREELLYDLANRRDDGELRWIKPKFYSDHVLNWWARKDAEERLEAYFHPNRKRLTP